MSGLPGGLTFFFWGGGGGECHPQNGYSPPKYYPVVMQIIIFNSVLPPNVPDSPSKSENLQEALDALITSELHPHSLILSQPQAAVAARPCPVP